MTLTANELAPIRDLYEQGLYLQAWQASQSHGPLAQWQGTEARLLAGRMAGNLGATRLARTLHRLAWRRDPGDPEARFYYLFSVAERRGVLEAWEKAQAFGPPPEDAGTLHADWWAFLAVLLGSLRDFAQADEAIERAKSLAPQQAWIWVEWSALLQMEDRHAEALEASQEALRIRPWYRPAVQSVAHGLMQADRLDEAIHLLTEASQRIESGDLMWQLATMQEEREQYDQARQSLLRAQELYPLIGYEKRRSQGLLARLSDIACLCGDYDAAADLAEQSDLPYHKAMAERLRRTPREPKRVLLPVGFVKQHHLTCAPATLAALVQYWGQSADHLGLVEAICYDGTPGHSERRWAEQQGFLAREFRVTWESATALLDAGIPFTFTTVDPGNAHLQAVIGYDALRGTLLVRDPDVRIHSEFRVPEVFDHYKSSGPRGMTLAAPEKAAELAAIELPEAELYDRFYQVELALQRHEREEAAAILEAMQSAAPGHRLTLYAARTIAAYDGDSLAGLEATERLLEQFPDDGNFLLARLGHLDSLGRRKERLALLEELQGKKDTHGLFLLQYAQELSDDFRQSDKAERLARRALRLRGADPRALKALADVRWGQQRRAEAIELYRFACCAGDKDDFLARCFVMAARHGKRMSEALAMLEERAQRDGRKSSAPARRLAWAYEQLEQADRAFQTLEEALALRSDDGDLLLHAARFFMSYGRAARAAELLEAARPNASRAAWLRAAASMASMRSDFAEALALWQEVLALEPLAMDANESVASLLSSVHGDEAAIEHVCRQVEKLPHNYHLRQLRIEWARAQDAATVEATCREMLAMYPDDAWARRELAISLHRQRRYDEALPELSHAEALDPASPVVPLVRGEIYEDRGDREAARGEFRKSLALSVDYDTAMDALLRTCDTKQERIEALEFIAGELARQVNLGDGLWNFRHLAAMTLDPEPLLKILREAHGERPDLWQSWSALSQQLLAFERPDEALAIARGAVERFPLLPRLWLDLAAVERERGDREAELAAVQKALEINPGWAEAERWLASMHRQAGELDEAQAALERAIRAQPRDCRCHADLAQVLWAKGEGEAALAAVKKGVEVEPAYATGWAMLRDWSDSMGKPEIGIDAARELTQRRPSDPRAWLTLAHALIRDEDLDERLAAFDRAIALDPLFDEAHSDRAYALAAAGRFDEALAACAPPAYAGRPPLVLRSREAQVVAMQGDLPEAVARMQSVVEADPDYPWAWSQLADWLRTLERHEEYLQVAQELVRLTPQNEVSYGYRGDAFERLGRREEARRDYARAIEIAPDYFFGVRALIEMHLEDDDASAAAETLEATAPHMPPGYAAAYEVRLARARHEEAQAIDRFRRMLDEPMEELYVVHCALAGLYNAEISRDWADAVAQAQSAQRERPDLGRVWARLALNSRPAAEVAHDLTNFRGGEEAWAAAAAEFLKIAADGDGQQRLAARRIIDRFRMRLGSHEVTWAAVGDALVSLDMHREAVVWLEDWRSHEDVSQETLLSLSIALREMGRMAEGASVNQHALSLPPDGTDRAHRLWLAVDSLLAGDEASARQTLVQLGAGFGGEHAEALAAMTHDTLDALTQVNGEAPNLRELSAKLHAHVSSVPPDALLTRVYHLYMARLAKRRGKPFAAWLSRLRANWQKV